MSAAGDARKRQQERALAGAVDGLSERDRLTAVLREHYLLTRPGRGCVWIVGCCCGFDTPLIGRWATHVADRIEGGA